MLQAGRDHTSIGIKLLTRNVNYCHPRPQQDHFCGEAARPRASV